MIGARHKDRPVRTWSKAILCAIFSGGISVVPNLSASAHAAEATSQNVVDAALSIPTVLGSADAARYAAIFTYQDQANWKAADAEIALLKDKVLLGSVLAQRYLSPHYQVSFAEARDWLEHYADLPEARAVWAVAKKRAPRAALPKPQPASAQATAVPAVDDQPQNADEKLPAEPRSLGLEAPPRFEAGLAAWRSQNWASAVADFEAVARAPGTPSWYVAAGAFWAGRAHLMLKEPQKVDYWFALAADEPRTFYGMLARHTLGLTETAQIGPKPLSKAEIAQLQSQPAGNRALALVQVREIDRAEAELRALSTRSPSKLASAVMALADLANMPSLCLALGQRPGTDARHVDARYPVPRWQPRDGFSVDRALLFALMLQESQFDAEAQNNSGAAGLMQLMPATAKSVARQAGFPLHSASELVDPVVNLSLGQEYVKLLIEHQQINGNLILMLAAYQSGTSALTRWQTQAQYPRDPLLFIETLPHQENRLYVERVLTNMWIYRQRLGQPASDLDALAANQWPTYVSIDETTPKGRQHAASR
ncbi:MAG TPA: transglycosylase SLT domain-containing protein [Aliidongia sp.]|nr:transglycosylase SLT domain-containing protein [Aliidongia sp.]